MAGLIKVGESCRAQGYYFVCELMKEEEIDTYPMCPYIKGGINLQNECPYNQLKGGTER